MTATTPDGPDWRYELKFELRGIEVRAVEGIVRRHTAWFTEAFPARIVNNIYLDTPDLMDVRMNVAGLARRDKLRMRWYGDATEHIDASRLENKIRRGGVGTKESCALPAWDVPALHTARDARTLFADVSDRLAVLVQRRRPVLFNRYRRRYFASPGRPLRLTIDDELVFSQVGAGVLRARPPLSPRVIVEIKFPTSLQPAGFAAASMLPWRVCRFSKYVHGVRWLYGSPSGAGVHCVGGGR